MIVGLLYPVRKWVSSGIKPGPNTGEKKKKHDFLKKMRNTDRETKIRKGTRNRQEKTRRK